MFKKLKEKITEGGKSPPQRLAQSSQQPGDKIQNLNQPEDSFYSIGEDDVTPENASSDHGFSSVNLVSPSDTRFRRNSSSSINSDVSFLPRYESNNLYHLQSDLDVSASEIEDNASSSSQAGNLSKEAIFSAFKKSQMRYHKYRGRYTDLARHYKELERENAKMKSVLVDTQDKAIRRVTELKEQCSLAQKAKAHLESELRVEIDEKQLKIQTLETKINLLQNGSGDTLVDLNNEDEISENFEKSLNDMRKEIENLNERIQEYKAAGIVFQSKETAYKNKIISLEKQISNFSDLEKESNIKLAEAKMDLHNELNSKDNEISRLKKELEIFKNSESLNVGSKIENLQSQNKKLIEKVENLTLKNNNLESELLKIERYKIEIKKISDDNIILKNTIDKLKEGIDNFKQNFKMLSNEKNELIDSIKNDKLNYENQIENMRENTKKALISLENKIRDKISNEYFEKEQKLKHDFTQKINEISSNNKTSKELQIKLIETEELLKKNTELLNITKSTLQSRNNQYENLEKNHLGLIDEYNLFQKTFEQFRDEVRENTEKLDEILKQKEIENVELTKQIIILENRNKEVESKLRIFEEKSEMIELESSECKLLELKLQKIEEDKKMLLESFEKERKMFNDMLEDNKELKLKEAEVVTLKKSIKHMETHIIHLDDELKGKENTIVELGKIKYKLEGELSKLKEQTRISQEREESIELDKTECQLLQIKLQKLEEEKEKLLKSFENERKKFDEHFERHRTEILHETEHIKHEIEKENIELSQENLKLKKTNDEINRKLRLFEEKVESVELEKNESKLLELKVQKLNEEKKNLLNEFEVERKMFNELLQNNKDLQLKEEKIKVLIDSNRGLEDKLCQLDNTIKKLENDNIDLHKLNQTLQKQNTKLKESIRIFEEKQETTEIDKNECSLLQMKLQSLENEHTNALKSYEVERKNFEETFTKIARYEEKIQILNRENDNVTFKLRQESDRCQKAVSENQTNLKKIHDLTNTVQSLSQMNEGLKKDCEHFEIEIGDLKGKLVEKNKEIEDINAENEVLKVELNNLKDVVNSNEKNEIESELKQKIIEYKVVVEEKNMLIKERDSAINEVEDLRDNFKKIQEENVNLLITIDNLKQIEENYVNLKNNYDMLENESKKLKNEISELENRLKQISNDNKNILDENQKLILNIEELKIKNDTLEKENLEKNVEIEKITSNNSQQQNEDNFYEIKEKYDNLLIENKNLLSEYTNLQSKYANFEKTKSDLEKKISQIENQYSEMQNEKQLLLDEIQELKTPQITSENKLDNLQLLKQEKFVNEENYIKEIKILRDKLTQYKSLDLTNKSSIEFYENELQKSKNKNEKLSRQLDETLVTLNHCAELSSSTEIEYLKNVLYNYMLGKESIVLARVIAAVCKFDPAQTETVLQREQQKQTLLGQLGFI